MVKEMKDVIRGVVKDHRLVSKLSHNLTNHNSLLTMNGNTTNLSIQEYSLRTLRIL
jgi:hypothetical protein